MRKILKIFFVVIAALIIALVAGFGIVISDVAGNFATDTHPLPNGSPIGEAIIVYDPGLSGGAKDVATKIGYNLQDSGYNVVLAGVKSTTASDLSSYDVIVIGGPIYAGKPASTIQSYLSSLTPPTNSTVGIFGYGSVAVDTTDQSAVLQDVASLPSDSQLMPKAAVKVTSSGNVDAECENFVMQLLA